MNTIFDYIQWRGDLSESACKFSGVDFAILSQIAFLDLGKVFTDETISLTVKEAYDEYIKTANMDSNLGLIFSNSAKLLLKAMAKAPRFKDLIMSDYVYSYDEVNDEQFAAITFTLENGEKVVAYSGTDDTIVGWKEDFALIYKDEIMAQKRGLKYLEKIAETTDKIYLTGHSKGANLVMYALFYCSDKTYKKIVSARGYDGPGFFKPITDETVIERGKKLIEYCPQTSLFGRMFHHYGKQKIIESSFKAAFQHDVFSWRVERNKFVQKAHFEEISCKTDAKIREIVYKLSLEERERLVRVSFDVLARTGARSLTDLNLMRFELVKSFWNTNVEDRRFLSKIFMGEFFKDKNVRSMFIGDMFDKKAYSVLKNSKKYAIKEIEDLKAKERREIEEMYSEKLPKSKKQKKDKAK